MSTSVFFFISKKNLKDIRTNSNGKKIIPVQHFKCFTACSVCVLNVNYFNPILIPYESKNSIQWNITRLLTISELYTKKI